MADSKSDILQGTLDLMVLKTLDAMGPMHGYGIARRIEQLSEEALQVNQGTIYLCLIRLVQKGWIDAEWGTSENNRKAKFYSISRRPAGSSSPPKPRTGSASPASSAGCCMLDAAEVSDADRAEALARARCARSFASAAISIATSSRSWSRTWRC